MVNKSRQQQRNIKARKTGVAQKHKADPKLNSAAYRKRREAEPSSGRYPQYDYIQQTLNNPVTPPEQREEHLRRQEQILCRLFGEEYRP